MYTTMKMKMTQVIKIMNVNIKRKYILLKYQQVKIIVKCHKNRTKANNYKHYQKGRKNNSVLLLIIEHFIFKSIFDFDN